MMFGHNAINVFKRVHDWYRIPLFQEQYDHECNIQDIPGYTYNVRYGESVLNHVFFLSEKQYTINNEGNM